MNNKEYQNFSEDREIQNRFTAYVQEALKNTCSTYYTKKMIREERETVYDEANDFNVTDSGDMLDTLFSFNMDMLENLSLWKAMKNFPEGISLSSSCMCCMITPSRKLAKCSV